jgi:cytochrome c oxidase assembly factor CtaG
MLRPLLALPPVEKLRVLAHPLVALPLWALNLYVWHLPALYEGAIHHGALHALEHACFLGFGMLMWAPVVEVLPGPAWFGTGWKLAYVVAVRLIEGVLGNVFFWAGAPIYATYADAPRLWGISALADQGYAGGIMMVEGSLVTLGALAWLFLRLAEEGELRQELLERGLDRRSVERAVRYGRGQELSEGR